MTTPEDVINALRATDGYIPLIFMNGGCWNFHEFLKVIFPAAEAYKVALNTRNEYDHIITRIEGGYYDIMGRVRTDEFKSCLPVEKSEAAKFGAWSFERNNLLFKRCPHCGEKITFTTTGKTETERSYSNGKDNENRKAGGGGRW